MASARKTSRTSWIALAIILVSISILVGCPKPAVDVEESPGQKGGACASVNDCAEPLQCVEQVCCADSTCISECRSLLEKDGTTASATVTEYPHYRPFLIRKCTEACCAGADHKEREASLEIWSRPMTGP